MKHTGVGDKVKQLLLMGKKTAEIRQLTGASETTIYYHRNVLGISGAKWIRRDWDEIQQLIDSGETSASIRKRFGISNSLWFLARKEGKIIAPIESPRRYISLTEFASANFGIATRRVRYKLKEKMLREGTPFCCAICGISEWRGIKLDLRLDHINGDAGNHNPNNLRLVCPNCDSQLPTFSHRNIGRKNSVKYRDDIHLFRR